MPFISQCYLVWFLYYSHFKYRMCYNLKENSGAKGLITQNMRIHLHSMKKEFTSLPVRNMQVFIVKAEHSTHHEKICKNIMHEENFPMDNCAGNGSNYTTSRHLQYTELQASQYSTHNQNICYNFTTAIKP
jgi:hypothetical protein